MLISFEKFAELARQANVVPVVSDRLADTETPASANLKILGESPYSFLSRAVKARKRSGVIALYPLQD